MSTMAEKGATRGAEAVVFSPPATSKSTSGDATFRSPKPAKASNIRVVTRIRPLLDHEIVRGRTASVLPIPCENQPTESASTNPAQDAETAISPRSNQSSSIKFRPSKIQPPSLQDGNLLPQKPKSPSFLPLPKSASPRNQATAAPASTSLYASLGATSKKQFDFDAVLGMETTQQQVYDTAVGDKLKNVFRGINFTIMAYGQTSSGKSHTMQGYKAEAENVCPNGASPKNGVDVDVAEHDGIIPRAIHDLFQGKMDYRSSGKGDVTIEMTYCELYNDDIRDLLIESTDFQNLKLIDQGDQGGIFIEGLTTVPIHSAEQAHDLINYAAQRRATASTNLNIQSSRSHSICALTVSITPFGKKSRGTEITQAKLTLVDLAGSERIKKSGVVGVQQQESITINKDLFVLGKVVAALADNSRKERHVPYRDSKLTRLLRESLGGNCFTVLISCVSPADSDIEESMNTLRYAERARSISNTIKRNVSQALLTPAQCTAITQENMRLKAMVVKLKKRVAAEVSRDSSGSLLDQEEESYEPKPPSEIFRVDSQSTASSFSPPEEQAGPVLQDRRSDKPIWMHFADLAKITKNVATPVAQVAVPVGNQSELPKEIELGERAPKTEASSRPERCLSYEMALLPCGPDENLIDQGDHAAVSPQAPARKRDAKIEEEASILRKELDALKKEKSETEALILVQKQGLQEMKERTDCLKTEEIKLEASIDQRKKTLDAITIEYNETEASRLQSEHEVQCMSEQIKNTSTLMQNQNHELARVASQVSEKRRELQEAQASIDALQKETRVDIDHELARRDNLRDEADQLESMIETLTNNINLLDLSSPQRSFAKIWDTYNDENDAKSLSNLKSLEKQLTSSFGLCDSPKTHSPLKGDRQEAQVPESLLADPQSDIPDKIDLTATVQEQQHMENLENQLCRETRLRRKSDPISLLCNVQTGGLQEEISELESKAASHTGEKLGMQQTIAALQSKLAAENDARKSLEESLNFATQDYDCMATTLNEKLLDMQDKASNDKALNVELESKVQLLQKGNDDAETEKSALLLQVSALEEKFKTFEREREANACQILSTDSDKPEEEASTLAILANIAGSVTDDLNANSPQSAQNECIKAKTSDMLAAADAAIGDAHTSSCCSSAGTDFRPGSPNAAIQMKAKGELEEIKISNLNLVEKDQEICSCSSNLFAGKTEYVEFYLPRITVECTCGRSAQKPDTSSDPCALESILRPWQVEFLADVGIKDAVSLVHTCNQRKGALATKLRQWRRKKDLPTIKTKSCGVALHIWSKTCKTVVRSIRSQCEKGVAVPRRPELLELNISENNTAISSLGGNWPTGTVDKP